MANALSDTQDEPSTVPSIVVMVSSVMCAALLAWAAVSAEENPAKFWFGLGAVVSASLSVVVGAVLVAVGRSSRVQLSVRRVAAGTAAVSVIALVSIVVGGQGADQWCTNEGFSRSSQGAAESLSLSWWPPGVRCTLSYDGERTEVHWPVDW